MEVKIKASSLLQEEVAQIMAHPERFLIKQLANAKLLGPLSGGMNGSLLFVPDIPDLQSRKEKVLLLVDFLEQINKPEDRLRILGDFSHEHGALIIAAKDPADLDLLNKF